MNCHRCLLMHIPPEDMHVEPDGSIDVCEQCWVEDNDWS